MLIAVMEAMSSEKVFSSKGPVRLLSIAVLTYHLSEGQWERSSDLLRRTDALE